MVAFLNRLLQLKHPHLLPHLTLTRAQEMVHAHCYLSLEYQAELEEWASGEGGEGGKQRGRGGMEKTKLIVEGGMEGEGTRLVHMEDFFTCGIDLNSNFFFDIFSCSFGSTPFPPGSRESDMRLVQLPYSPALAGPLLVDAASREAKDRQRRERARQQLLKVNQRKREEKVWKDGREGVEGGCEGGREKGRGGRKGGEKGGFGERERGRKKGRKRRREGKGTRLEKRYGRWRNYISPS